MISDVDQGNEIQPEIEKEVPKRRPYQRNFKKYLDKNFGLEFFKLDNKELKSVTKILEKKLSSTLKTGNKKRLKSLQERAEAEMEKGGKKVTKANLEEIPVT